MKKNISLILIIIGVLLAVLPFFLQETAFFVNLANHNIGVVNGAASPWPWAIIGALLVILGISQKP